MSVDLVALTIDFGQNSEADVDLGLDIDFFRMLWPHVNTCRCQFILTRADTPYTRAPDRRRNFKLPTPRARHA